jgi:hypothetical protein
MKQSVKKAGGTTVENTGNEFVSFSSRREFLIKSAPILGMPLLLPLLAYEAQADQQGEWRICRHCYALFFNGFPKNKADPGRAIEIAFSGDYLSSQGISQPSRAVWSGVLLVN